ncbi:ionotropic receptor 40a [Bradysia coprophila]|uniref:ionotropic receptor 40a n=1 Tax=Bradysia coprophila TaxID=38358 RepID=UPI00187DD5E4|nr:ionotropic receptor 40a [Bradysia coprophila]
MKYIHESSELKTCIFYDFEQYFQNIEENQKGFIETTSLIFAEPFHILRELRNRNLGHRLSLFVFFWNATHLPKRRDAYHFSEPFRIVLIIRSRLAVLRVYYNQATPHDMGELKLVNWYDANSLGLFKVPLLPSPKDVYRNFGERVLSIPIIHSPPWYFVKYNNYSEYNDNNDENGLGATNESLFHVTGGRDFNLLKLIAKKMNFNVNYIDPLERTQGSSIIEADTDNLSFSGALGKIQRREADLLLGDVGITFERKKAVEFSFFTLVDSGAFVTHSPRKLSEAFALIRPFRKEVWPFLILTVVISGPAFYYVVAIPYWWQRGRRRKMHLFQKCIWFSVTLFLKQSCNVFPFSGIRAKCLSSMLWLAATYVLADVYSAQLTSQLASPAREPPINTLQRLETAMLNKGYQLYVERQSSSLSILENSTAIFNRLYRLMKHQSNSHNHGYLVSSVEEGISLIKEGSTKAILGGRETLYFNMKRYGTQNFQISEKLYTRYSAVAVQTGCPFLESLNEVLMHLFEGGILEKMTNAEYERMIQMNQMNEENLRTSSVENTNHQQPRLVEPKLQPINLRILQGAFFALAFGYVLAALTILIRLSSNTCTIKLHQLNNRPLV